MTVYNYTADTTFFTADTTLYTADVDPYAPAAPVTKTTADYVGRITPWQANPLKARFLATVTAGVQPYADGQAVIASLPQAFDVDEAIGVQLDAVGAWIGRDRNVPTPVPNTLFSFDTVSLGFDQGLWQGPYDSSLGVSQLIDADYRRLLYAKIAGNSWDGTTTGALSTLTNYFSDPSSIVFIDDFAAAIPYQPNSTLFSFDIPGRGFDQGSWAGPFDEMLNGDLAPLAYTVCVSQKQPSNLDLFVLGYGLIPVRAMAADVNYSVTTVNNASLFGFDMNDNRVAGFDIGAWGADPITVAGLPR